MLASIKSLLYVLAIAAIVFQFAKPIALRFSTAEDFKRRRNVWLALTITAFLSPNFWIFVLVAVPLLRWAVNRDSTPIALYLLLLHVIPSIPIRIPIIGINNLFELDIYRLLAFVVLVPTASRLRDSTHGRIARLQAGDWLLLAYGVLQTVLFVPAVLPNHVLVRNSFTSEMRRAALFLLDAYLVYWVTSRSCSDRRSITDAMAAFCLACVLMASLAIFESVRHWLLYVELASRWSGDAIAGFYLMRGDVLRAQVSAGHALALGYLLAVAFGFWLYLRSHVSSRKQQLAVSLILCLGLMAAYSRGPWLGALVIYLTFSVAGPRGLSRLAKAATTAAASIAMVFVSPLGERVTRVLPFLGGSVDSGSVDYRSRIVEESWKLIRERPLFGDQLALFKLEVLRQGEGIIDLVNTYVDVALFYGLIGLACFLGPVLIGLLKTYECTRTERKHNSDFALLGTALVSCILGTLVMISSCSFILGYEKMYYVLAGLAAAYVHACQSRESS